MKAITLSAATLMLFGTLTLAMAADVTTEMTVDEQITAIKNAPAQERVRLMNQFKVRLATMNEAEREAAITQLRTQTQTQTRTATGDADGEQIQTRTMTQERSRLNEMQQTQQMQQMQQMNQQQIRQKGSLETNPTPKSMGH
ncbi:hypothetical protein [Sulfurimonas sp. HSL3-7]|uniref:hypothetical protein n=1 Tax=Sulfonitrofixus jiaomeiensis TaxID=3131938 RepID=UPI0031F83023